MKYFINFILFLFLTYSSYAAKVTDSVLTVGKDAATDFTILHKDGGYLKKTGSQGDWFFSKDGNLQKKIGSGSGSGGGDNFNNGFTSDQNASAEDGAAGWAASAGVFSASTTDPLEGEQSFVWTPSAQNDTLDGPVLNFNRDIFKGQACEGRIEYIGGDENLTLQVVNGNSVVVAEQALQAHSIFGQESVFFLCPSATDIAGDAQLGNLRYRITNTGATASPLIKFDKAYLGTLRGLTETTLPDVFSASLDANCNVTYKSADFIVSTSNAGTGLCNVTVKTGLFTVPPSLGAVVNASASGLFARSVHVEKISLTQFSYSIGYSTAREDLPIDISFTKQGADAKQSVQVYKSIPKVSENINTFANMVNTGAGGTAPGIALSNADIYSGVSYISTGTHSVSFKPGVFASTPVVSCSSFSVANIDIINISQNGYGFEIRDMDTGALVNLQIEVHCNITRAGDFKLPTVQPIIVGQLTTGQTKNLVIYSGVVDGTSGTPILVSHTGNLVSSVTKTGVGYYGINFNTGKFSTGTVYCNFTALENGGGKEIAQPQSPSTTGVSLFCYRSSDETNSECAVNFTCIGNK